MTKWFSICSWSFVFVYLYIAYVLTHPKISPLNVLPTQITPSMSSSTPDEQLLNWTLLPHYFHYPKLPPSMSSPLNFLINQNDGLYVLISSPTQLPSMTPSISSVLRKDAPPPCPYIPTWPPCPHHTKLTNLYIVVPPRMTTSLCPQWGLLPPPNVLTQPKTYLKDTFLQESRPPIGCWFYLT